MATARMTENCRHEERDHFVKNLLTFVDNRIEVSSQDEDGNEHQIECDGEGDKDPGEYLPGVPGGRLVHSLLRLTRLVRLVIILIILIFRHCRIGITSFSLKTQDREPLCGSLLWSPSEV